MTAAVIALAIALAVAFRRARRRRLRALIPSDRWLLPPAPKAPRVSLYASMLSKIHWCYQSDIDLEMRLRGAPASGVMYKANPGGDVIVTVRE